MLFKTTYTFVLFAALTLATSACAQNIEWQRDLDQAKQQAAKDGKLVLMHFYADWCGPCQQLDTFVFNRESVSRAVDEGMVAVKIDIDVHPDLVSEYGVKSIPFDVVISPNGNMVHRQKSPSTSDNYLSMVTRLSGMNTRLAEQGETIDPGMFRKQIVNEEANRPINQADTMQFNASSVDFRPSQKSQALAASDGQFRPRGTSGPSTQARTTGTIDFVTNHHVQQDETTSSVAATPQDFQPRTDAQATFAPRPQRVVNEIAANSMNTPTNQEPIFSPESIQIQPRDVRAKLHTRNDVETANTTPNASNQPVRIKNNRSAPPAPRTSFALNGNCPVSLLTISKWVPGNEKFGCVHRGKTYLFASREHMDTFLANPDKYSPVLAGFDPVAFSDSGEFHEGEESLGVFMSKGGVQKIVLFENMENREKFQENPKRYLEAVRVATEKIDANVSTIRR